VGFCNGERNQCVTHLTSESSDVLTPHAILGV